MKKLVLFALLTLSMLACKKEESIQPKQDKPYFGNAIYNPSDVIRDFSTYQSYPTTIGKDVIYVQPASTEGLPSLSADDMIIGSTCYIKAIVKDNGLSYLYNITTLVKGKFTSNRTIQLDTCSWSNYILVRGTIKLNEDNSLDIEYTDSIKDGTNGTNHYKIHYTKLDR